MKDGVPVSVERRQNIAIVRLDKPPVNAIGATERRGLLTAAVELSSDPAVKAVVLTGAGAAFAAGSDAREFDGPPIPPHLPEVNSAIASSEKPWIAAIRGPALGGGLELALACDMRIAAPNALLGLPEVALGIVPGAGGTQFLPRLVGFSEAVAMIAQGMVIKADRALAIGLVDEISDDPLDRACIVATDMPKRRISELPAPRPDESAAAIARETAKRKTRGQKAPLRAIELVELASRTELQAGLKTEREAFLELRHSPEARALRHVFFAERGARIPPANISGRAHDITSIAVVGGGTMGSGIAYALLQAGLHVTLIEMNEVGVAHARSAIAALIADGVSRGLLDRNSQEALDSRISFQTGYGDLESVGLVIEAAFEDLGVKKQIFAALDGAAPGAFLATNTSYLDINEIAAATTRPQDVLGLHFFSPAYIMRLLEIVRAGATSDDAIQTAFALVARLKKLPVLAGVCEGFIGNRILTRYRETAGCMLLEGATPWDIDAAMVEFGYAMGPFQAQDLSGLDIAHANYNRHEKARPQPPLANLIGRLVTEGRVGRKTGRGWYDYSGKGAVADPAIEKMVKEESRRAGIVRHPLAADDIRKRLLEAMMNEASEILREGIARSASDIDLVTIHGYGFPRWRGGLMHYGSQINSSHDR